MSGRNWPAIAASAGALALLGLVAWLVGFDPLHAATWARWDSGHYESIARGGYEVHRCAPGETDNGGVWCGNAAWLPGYPLLIAAVHATGAPLQWSAVVISWLFALASLVLLWRTFLRDVPRLVAAGGLVFAAVAPGLVYGYGVFPLSMLVFLTIAYLWLLTRERWIVAGLVGAAAAVTYPIGVTLPFIAAVWIVATRRAGRTHAIVLAAAPAPLAFAIFMATQRLQTGRWSAFFDVQSQYGTGVHDPIGVTWNSVLIVLRADHPFSHYHAGELQTLIVGLILVAVVVHYLVRARGATRVDHLLVLWAIVTGAFPATQANVSLWRSNAARMPLAVLVARLPRPLLAAAVIAAAAIASPVAWLFFQGRLI